ncbi:MAG: site-2 protease family protein [Saprospiraceae bacterium]|nr:site-2 protease family protein [Saprospiraceae bacterium]
MENRNSLKNKIKSGAGNAFKIGTFWQIPVKIHWSFGLLLLFVLYTAFTNGLKMWQSIGFVFYVLLLFLCVVFHEYGHALTARRYGVITRDILLSPIGGVARLESMPDKPKQEFFIAIAGPIVNIIIATILGLILFFTTGQIFPDVNDFRFDDPAEFVRYIAWMNLALFMFNLIPAFPMDGGRILRALLAAKLGKVRATHIAMRIGRILAIGFVIFGIFNQQLILAMIGLFIFMMAGQEYEQTRVMSILSKTRVRDIMRTSFTKLHLSDSYAHVLEKYYREGEQNFLVFDSMGNLSGTVPELFIKDTIKNNTPDKSVNQLMSSRTVKVSPEDMLKDVIEKMKTEGVAIVAVEDNNQLIGILDRNNIENHIKLKSD